LDQKEEAYTQISAKSQAYLKIVSTTAHDLRTGASAIESGCRLLNMNLDSGNVGQLPSVVESMAGASKYMTHFLEGMALSAAFLEGKNLFRTMDHVSLQDTIDSAMHCAKLAW